MAASTFGLERRCWSFPQWCYLHHLHTIGWRGGAKGKAFGLAINRSRVQILLEVCYVMGNRFWTWNWGSGDADVQ